MRYVTDIRHGGGFAFSGQVDVTLAPVVWSEPEAHQIIALERARPAAAWRTHGERERTRDFALQVRIANRQAAKDWRYLKSLLY